MDYLEKQIKFYEITPEQAQKWLSVCNFDNQRNTRNWWVDYLAKEMLADRFEAVANITFVTAADTKIFYNINGKHTLHAIVKSGKSQTLPVSSFVVDNEQKVKELFSRIDKNLKRTAKDSISILEIDEKLGLNKTHTSYLYTAINRIAVRLSRGSAKFSKYTENEILIVMKDFENEYKLFVESLAQDNFKFYKNGNIIALALLMIRYNLDKAIEFWRAVAGGEGRNKSPEWVLYEFLHYYKKYDYYEIQNNIAYCWNKFLQNKDAILTQEKINKEFENGFYLRSIDINFQDTAWEKIFFDFNSGS